MNMTWELTEVVRTPQSWAVGSGVGAGGVSMNSNDSSDMAFSCSLITTKFKASQTKYSKKVDDAQLSSQKVVRTVGWGDYEVSKCKAQASLYQPAPPQCFLLESRTDNDRKSRDDGVTKIILVSKPIDSICSRLRTTTVRKLLSYKNFFDST